MANFVERVRETISNAKSVIASCEGLLTEMGAPAPSARTSARTARRGRPPSAQSTAAPASPAGKVSMQQIPELIRERFGEAGCNYEQIRQMAGWKATAPASNVKRLLVNTGKLTLDQQGIYRAPPATPQAQAA